MFDLVDSNIELHAPLVGGFYKHFITNSLTIEPPQKLTAATR